jgi:hypothetical protein
MMMMMIFTIYNRTQNCGNGLLISCVHLCRPTIHFSFVRFKVLTATSMKMTVFSDVAPCSLVDTDRRFRDAYCLHHQGIADRSIYPEYTAQHPRRQLSSNFSFECAPHYLPIWLSIEIESAILRYSITVWYKKKGCWAICVLY